MALSLAEQHAATNVSHVTTDITPQQIGDWIASRWPEWGPIEVFDLAMAQGGGSSSIVVVSYRKNGEDDRMVLRLQPADDPVFPPAGYFNSSPELEWAVQCAVRDAAPSVPLPELMALETDPAPLGRPFFAMSHITGTSLTTFGFMRGGPLAAATPDQRRELMLVMMDHLAAIHAVDWRAAKGMAFDVGEGGRDTTLRHVERLAREVEDKLAGRSCRALEEGVQWLRDHAPDDDRIGLVWGDARVGNTMQGVDFQPLALLDWEGAAILPTEADVGWWSLFDKVEREQEGGPLMDGFPTLAEQQERYVQASGRDIRNCHYWEMMAAIKSALAIMRTRDRLEKHGLALPHHQATRFDNFATHFIETRL